MCLQWRQVSLWMPPLLEVLCLQLCCLTGLLCWLLLRFRWQVDTKEPHRPLLRLLPPLLLRCRLGLPG